MTLYLGAGGGGDTNSAILRALSHPKDSGDVYVLGAGYSREEYCKSLKDGVLRQGIADTVPKPDKTDECYKYFADRLPCPDASAINEYLGSVLSKYKFTEQSTTEVYQLKDGTKNSDDKAYDRDKALFDKLVTPKNNPTSFGYRSLREESQLLADLKKADPVNTLYDNIYMFYSTDTFKESLKGEDGKPIKDEAGKPKIEVTEKSKANAKKLYDGLKLFITEKKISTVYLMDFGADIFDFKKLARDTAVLLAIAKIIEDMKATAPKLIIEVYGPGVDAHAPIGEVIANLNNVKPLSEIISVNPLFIDLLERHKDGAAKDLMKSGRATGNFYIAYKASLTPPSAQTAGGKKHRKKVGGDDITTSIMIPALKERSEFKNADSTTQSKIIESTTAHTIKHFAQLYQFTISKDTIQDFIGYLNTLKVAQESLGILSDAIKLPSLSTTGGAKDLKKTNEKVKVGNRDAVVYETPRGAKYIKLKGGYIKVKDITKTLKNNKKTKNHFILNN